MRYFYRSAKATVHHGLRRRASVVEWGFMPCVYGESEACFVRQHRPLFSWLDRSFTIRSLMYAACEISEARKHREVVRLRRSYALLRGCTDGYEGDDLPCMIPSTVTARVDRNMRDVLLRE